MAFSNIYIKNEQAEANYLILKNVGVHVRFNFANNIHINVGKYSIDLSLAPKDIPSNEYLNYVMNEVFQRGMYIGKKDCQKEIRDSLGIKEHI